MVIPKSFEDKYDLEAMLLTCILGTLEALKEDLISFNQAQRYWISDIMAELFENLQLSDRIVSIAKESAKLKSLQEYNKVYNEKIDELINECKATLCEYYNQYDGNDIQLNNKLFS